MHGCCGKRKHELRKTMLKRYNKNKPIGTWYRKDKEKLKNLLHEISSKRI